MWRCAGLVIGYAPGSAVALAGVEKSPTLIFSTRQPAA
ncbi:hypothetical protein ECHM605_22924 [Escherichia coli HM605]|nr:hypothetical protein ECHM605_22924 [Escherichia coli HM605]EIL73223.1 hypothetical protein ECMT8_21812 [Escherichia coli CUMT8]ELX22956.1 hypothetical protein SEER_14178 [Salmonella enterica subsp. enterica serovar Rissen str. 150]EST61077.1 hypothetical protein ECCZ_19338 [Escherichia coli ECC-Z]EST77208.1 hypothetical protein ECC1470_22186 [Escherichia coli ECC-1470]